MAVIKQTPWVKGQAMTPVPAAAGVVVTQAFTYTISAALTAATDILEMGILPANCTVVDAILHVDEAGLAVWDAGIMSGDVGSTDSGRTSGAELFNDAADATVNRMSAIGGFKIAAVGYDRSLGVKASADVTAANQVITLIVSYKAV